MTTETTPSEASTRPAVLVLADGNTYRGLAFGAEGNAFGEAVFTTAMTGYQETMTDPSYHKQMVVMTAPQIGNTGWNDEDNESREDKIWIAGLIIRDLSHTVSNWRARRSLEEEMISQGLVGIKHVDTRAIVRHLRNYGSIKAGVFTGEDALLDTEELVRRVEQQEDMEGANLSADVSLDTPQILEPTGEVKATVVAYDMGIKSNTPRNLLARGMRTVLVPANYPFEKAMEFNPDGVFISNGPGDPATADEMVGIVQQFLDKDVPIFGICFGNQILGRAFGMNTYKLKFGHRGVNIPVKNHVQGHIEITAQNHGFALEGEAGQEFDTAYGPALVTHTCLNDGVVEGVALKSGRAFSVQYHPEAAAGPNDANPLFDQFAELVAEDIAAKSTAGSSSNEQN
ncbi:Carbamoyl-phosphate synthase small chain [Corynebacterium ciconiae DSM 44920]|uniref:glutamine-hydrolyzing carbamoyl-phosphate synthase small subunit n=1 Tax=Corynebacterium ciconiae TaxID=227319 RepID=UPI000375C08A|nr:glutamine-hydrolyzing carbamoyl-phosphate synthase small subunit [Corynebacterium ciconiae]WKD61300.1 Carbamoyl-phosphate synthase small chain [Corynebacterium ciconiae DSM 44920]